MLLPDHTHASMSQDRSTGGAPVPHRAGYLHPRASEVDCTSHAVASDSGIRGLGAALGSPAWWLGARRFGSQWRGSKVVSVLTIARRRGDVALGSALGGSEVKRGDVRINGSKAIDRLGGSPKRGLPVLGAREAEKRCDINELMYGVLREGGEKPLRRGTPGIRISLIRESVDAIRQALKVEWRGSCVI